MKVWGVRNFYSHLERVSEEGSSFSLGYLTLVVTSALFATGGLLANNVVVIIGAMCVAPFLGPSRAVSVGAVYKKWNTVGKGLIKQILGLVAIGSTVSFLATVVFFYLLPEIVVTPEIMARTLPTLTDVHLAMFIATVSGIVASFALIGSLNLVSEPYQERPRGRVIHYPRLFDATIGVEIAISLIPPASVLGIGLALGRFDILFRSIGLLLVNVWGLNIGSIVVLALWGVESKPLKLEKKIRRIAEETIKAVVKADEIIIGIVLHNIAKADIYVRLYAVGPCDHEELPARISRMIESETGVSNNVRIVVYPVHIHTSRMGSTSSMMEMQLANCVHVWEKISLYA
ncbi:MAG: DUF389 domain-containing protein [Candidatus Bathyarchaeota archaeon]|nr:MAG: DUF389 domain-containing protein [Candidatus Bathyarchaeota archaeon]